jgi:organic radical activating enzyme
MNEQRINVSDIHWFRTGNKSDHGRNVESIKQLLGQVGPGFCLAKFSQVTMHLGQGTVHSCHHPRVHHIPLEELKESPAALFNSRYLQGLRTEMKAGERPSECGYCWRIEDGQGTGTSDRFLKSMTEWSVPHYDIAINSTDTTIHYPSYLEVDFSNVCNFECIYCGPEFSSKWVENINRHGPVIMLRNTDGLTGQQGYKSDYATMHYKNKDHNPHLEAFWQWWPEMVGHLRVFRITGGEPLMSRETFKMMDYFAENPHPDIELNINSNLGVPQKLWDEFISKVEKLDRNNLTVYTSVDAWGARAEYIRTGLDFQLFQQRYIQLCELGIKVNTMCTFNILSVTSILDYLKWIIEMKRRFNYNAYYADLEQKFGFKWSTQATVNKPIKVGIDMPYLRHPLHLDVLATINQQLIQDYLIPAFKFVQENQSTTIVTEDGTELSSCTGFEAHEVAMFTRIVTDILDRWRTRDGERVRHERAKLFDFLTEIDERQGSSFRDTFPEMESLWQRCELDIDSYYNPGPLTLTNI